MNDFHTSPRRLVLAAHGTVSQEQKTGMQREDSFETLLRDSEGSATGVADAD